MQISPSLLVFKNQKMIINKLYLFHLKTIILFLPKNIDQLLKINKAHQLRGKIGILVSRCQLHYFQWNAVHVNTFLDITYKFTLSLFLTNLKFDLIDYFIQY